MTASLAPPCSGPYSAFRSSRHRHYGSARELPAERITFVSKEHFFS